MKRQKTIHHTVAALLLGLAAYLATFTAHAADEHPVIVIDTFEVHANAAGFIEMLGKAIKLSKKVNPGGGGSRIQVIAGHVEPESASMVTVATTYDNMDAYVANMDALRANAEMQALYKEMQAAKFNFIHRSVNRLVAEY